MADRTDFKRIQVTRSDDDVVIVAGARDDAREGGPIAADGAAARAEAPAPASAPAPEPVAARAASAGSGEDAYRGTTLEDIEESKMPTAQKVVVALAIAAVIAFIVWYAVVRP